MSEIKEENKKLLNEDWLELDEKGKNHLLHALILNKRLAEVKYLAETKNYSLGDRMFFSLAISGNDIPMLEYLLDRSNRAVKLADMYIETFEELLNLLLNEAVMGAPETIDAIEYLLNRGAKWSDKTTSRVVHLWRWTFDRK